MAVALFSWMVLFAVGLLMPIHHQVSGAPATTKKPPTTPMKRAPFVPMVIKLVRGDRYADAFYANFQSMSKEDLETFFSRNSQKLDPALAKMMKSLKN